MFDRPTSLRGKDFFKALSLREDLPNKVVFTYQHDLEGFRSLVSIVEAVLAIPKRAGESSDRSVSKSREQDPPKNPSSCVTVLIFNSRDLQPNSSLIIAKAIAIFQTTKKTARDRLLGLNDSLN